MLDSSQIKLYNKDSISEINCSHQRSSLLYGPDSKYTKYLFITIMLQINRTQDNMQYGGGTSSLKKLKKLYSWLVEAIFSLSKSKNVKNNLKNEFLITELTVIEEL